MTGVERAAEARKARALERVGESDAASDDDNVDPADNAEAESSATGSAQIAQSAQAQPAEKQHVFRWSDEADLCFVQLMKKYGREKCSYKERSSVMKKVADDFEDKFPEVKSRANTIRTLNDRLALLIKQYQSQRKEEEERRQRGEEPLLQPAARTEINAYIAQIVKVCIPSLCFS